MIQDNQIMTMIGAPGYKVPITFTNSQTGATGTNFQQMLTVNSNNYKYFLNATLLNVKFTTNISGSSAFGFMA